MRLVCYGEFCSNSDQGRLFLAPRRRQVTAADLLLQQTARAGERSDFEHALQVEGRVGLAVLGEQTDSGIRVGQHRGVMPSVDRQTEVGQQDQEKAQANQGPGSLETETTHLIAILQLRCRRDK